MLGIFVCIFLMVIAIFMFWWSRVEKASKHDADARTMKKVATVLVLISVLSIIFLDCIITVPAGTVGVKDTFGSVDADEFTMGLHIKNPFTDVQMFSIQTIEVKESSSVPSKEGLIVELDISILYKIYPQNADDIYKNIGVYYTDVVIVPQLRSVIREITAKYEAKALYTVGRENITVEIFDILEPILKTRGIILEKVLLRDLQLPSTVTTAIEMKLKAEQEAEQMQFVLQKETLEAQRKIIEAGGIAEAQSIIHQSLTPEYLRWYWITHLKDYSAVYYVPVGVDGYPIMNIPVTGGK